MKVYMDMTANFLNGTIPEQYGRLTNMVFFSCSSNFLTGTIPSSLGKWERVKTLNFLLNFLSGSIPSEFDLPELTFFEGGDNFLTGTLPFGPTSSLENLGVGNNQLNGTIERFLTHHNNLVTLNLGINNFTGPIPETVCNLTNLTWLLLVGSNFTGTIPSCLDDLQSLLTLQVAENSLTGTIPPLPKSLEFFSCAYNQLTGNIDQFVSFPSLKKVLMDVNSLSGTIPTRLGSNTALTYLSLGSNQFTGTIPSEIGKLTALENFLVDSNQHLFGIVPTELNVLPKLTFLFIARTNITGGDLTILCGKLKEESALFSADCDVVTCPCCHYCCYEDGRFCDFVV